VPFPQGPQQLHKHACPDHYPPPLIRSLPPRLAREAVLWYRIRRLSSRSGVGPLRKLSLNRLFLVAGGHLQWVHRPIRTSARIFLCSRARICTVIYSLALVVGYLYCIKIGWCGLEFQSCLIVSVLLLSSSRSLHICCLLIPPQPPLYSVGTRVVYMSIENEKCGMQVISDTREK